VGFGVNIQRCSNGKACDWVLITCAAPAPLESKWYGWEYGHQEQVGVLTRSEVRTYGRAPFRPRPGMMIANKLPQRVSSVP
jgi:hypothetical protein